MYEIKHIISSIRKDSPHFHHRQAISLCLVFPCLKISNRFSTTFCLSSNINCYNQQLINLSKEIHFNILDFKITNKHLAKDQIHVDYRFQHLIFNSIIDHVNYLIETSSTPTKTYLRSEVIPTPTFKPYKRKSSPYYHDTRNTPKRQ